MADKNFTLPPGLSSNDTEKEVKRRIRLFEEAIASIERLLELRAPPEREIRIRLLNMMYIEKLIGAVYEHLARDSRTRLVEELADIKERMLRAVNKANPVITTLTQAINETTNLADGEPMTFPSKRQTGIARSQSVQAVRVQVHSGGGVKRMASTEAHNRGRL